jgi:hypothetical protein
MDTFTEARQRLDTLLDELNAERVAVDEEAAAVAKAFEQLTDTTEGQAAWQQGGEAMRWKVVALIDHQLAYLQASSVSHTVLDTLRRMVVEVVA